MENIDNFLFTLESLIIQNDLIILTIKLYKITLLLYLPVFSLLPICFLVW